MFSKVMITYQEVFEVGHGLLELGSKHRPLSVVSVATWRARLARQFGVGILLGQTLERVVVQPLLDRRELGAACLQNDWIYKYEAVVWK